MLKPQTLDEIEGGTTHRGSVTLPRQTIAAAMLGALAVGTIWLASTLATPKSPAPTSAIHSDLGDLKVEYMIQTSPSSSSGSTLEGVSDIEFCPNYVVVKGRKGSGTVFPADKIRNLSWSR